MTLIEICVHDGRMKIGLLRIGMELGTICRKPIYKDNKGSR